jgi:hypothetical protein
MISRKTIAAGLIALTSFAALPAQAHQIEIQIGSGFGVGWSDGSHVNHWRHRLSPQEVRWMLRDRGYRNIRFLDDHGPVYQLRARKFGEVYYLVVSARSGEILARNRI